MPILRARLSWRGVREGRFCGADLHGASLAQALFRNAILPARARRADLTGASFVKSMACRADFAGAGATRLNSSNPLSTARLSTGRHFDWATFVRCDLLGAAFMDAVFDRTSMVGCMTAGVDLSGSNWHCASLLKADLRQARLGRCNLFSFHVTGGRFVRWSRLRDSALRPAC